METQDFKTGNTKTGIVAVNRLLNEDNVKNRFTEVLMKKTPGFIASISSLVGSNSRFANVEGKSVIGAAFIAATLDLPINQNLGFAYIIPYKGVAQFQMGYKGYIQLALRSGQYSVINATEVYEGELCNVNKLRGTYELREDLKKSDTVVGYSAYFQMTTGAEKMLYMSVEDVTKHAKRYSQAYKKEDSIWKTNFDAMAKKTVLKLLLSKYGIMSIEVNTAIKYDQAVINLKEDGETEEPFYIDVQEAETVTEQTEQTELTLN